MVSRAVAGAIPDHIHPMLLIHAEWHDGEVWVNSGVEAVTADGQVYQGFGMFCQVLAPEEGMGLATDDATVRLALPKDLALGELGQDVVGKLITAKWCATDKAAGGSVVAGPFDLFAGTFITRQYEETSDTFDLWLGVSFGPSARQSAKLKHTPEEFNRNGDTAGRHLILMDKFRNNPPAWPEK